MEEKATLIRFFVGSPSDVFEERKIVDEVLHELNIILSVNRAFRVESVKWENVIPGIGNYPQEVINRQTEDYDIFIGIMWSRYGIPTSKYNSGTEEEYERALKSYKSNGCCKNIMFFFSKRDLPQNTNMRQFSKVLEFKSKLAKDGVYYEEYDDLRDFEKKFRLRAYEYFVFFIINNNKVNELLSCSQNEINTAKQSSKLSNNLILDIKKDIPDKTQFMQDLSHYAVLEVGNLMSIRFEENKAFKGINNRRIEFDAFAKQNYKTYIVECKCNANSVTFLRQFFVNKSILEQRGDNVVAIIIFVVDDISKRELIESTFRELYNNETFILYVFDANFLLEKYGKGFNKG